MIFELNGSIVTITKTGMLIPQIKNLYDVDGPKKAIFSMQMQYLFFVYDKLSPYADMLMGDRKKIVCSDILKQDSKHWLKSEKNELKDSIEAINKIQFTPNEHLLQGVKEKIEEYLLFWKDTKIEAANHNLIADTLDNANKLLKLKDTIEKQVLEEKSQKQVGGGKSKLFED